MLRSPGRLRRQFGSCASESQAGRNGRMMSLVSTLTVQRMTRQHCAGSSGFGVIIVLVIAVLAVFSGVLPAFLLRIALVLPDKPFFLTGILTNIASILPPLHALGFGKHLVGSSKRLVPLILNLHGKA